MAKILLVDDDELMMKAFEKAFRFGGHETQMVSNGDEGLEKLKEYVPDIILCDMMMPKMDGLEFLGKVKSNPKYENIPVIMMTNLLGDDVSKTSLSKRATKHVVKSEITPKELVGVAEEILAGKTDK